MNNLWIQSRKLGLSQQSGVEDSKSSSCYPSSVYRNNLSNPLASAWLCILLRNTERQSWRLQSVESNQSSPGPSLYLHINFSARVTMTESAILTNEQSLHLEFLNVCWVWAVQEEGREQNITFQQCWIVPSTVWAFLPNPSQLPGGIRTVLDLVDLLYICGFIVL